MSTGPLEGATASGAGDRLWKQDEPCYSKEMHAAVVALGISRKSSLAKGASVKEEMLWLHQLHMKMDAVVVGHGANKFSGSSDSYLVVKTSDSKIEAAKAACEIGKELLEVSRDVSSIRAIAGHGEVGFGILGSTGWNYQFYGDLIESLKREASQCTPGKLHKTPELTRFLTENEESPSSSCRPEISEDVASSCQTDENPEVLPPSFEEWRGRNLQHVELWVLMITLLLSVLAMLGAVEKSNSNKQASITFVFQLQCLFFNMYALGIWFLNHERFVKEHNQLMVKVWISQLLNRFMGSLLMPLATARLFHLPWFLRLMAANGPEKLLLASTPLVSGRPSVLLHICGTASALLFSFRSCAEAKKGGETPYECQPFGSIIIFVLNICLFLIGPLVYASYCHRSAVKQYNQLRRSKGLKQM